MKIYDIVNEIKEQDLLLLQEENVDSEEMKIVKEMALKKIEQERTESVPKAISKKRLAVLIAAAVCIAAFSAVAYATEMFGLGSVKYLGEDTTMSVIEDSNQYKAMKEYRDYKEGLSQQDIEKLGEEHFIRKEKELCNKYGLKHETQTHYVKTAKEVFAKAGINNFLGEYEGDKGQFAYGDCGTVSMVLDKGDATFDIFCYPQDVFYGALPFAIADDNQSERTEWDYVTKSGCIAKCVSYKDKLSNEENATRFYEVAAKTAKHMVVMCIENTKITSQEQLEAVIDQFDFSVLK